VLAFVLALPLPLAVLLVLTRVVAPLAPSPPSSGFDLFGLQSGDRASHWQQSQQGHQATAGARRGKDA
jgi:hypothetical protein